MTKEAALECARQLFLLREGGPHRSGAPAIAELPTREEITIAQEALKEVIGEKGSEKRAAANKLAERGLIDLEEGLGHWLGDRFVGVLPAGEELARGVSKRASDKLPGKKDKARWKELTRQARRTAEKGGASPEAAAAAGVEAKAATVRRFMQTIVDVDFAAAGLAEAPAAPAPTEPEPAPAPTPAPAPQQKVLRLKGSVQAEEAVEAACGCEFAQTWLRPGIDKPLGFKPGWEAYDTWRLATHQEHRIERYLAAMKAIKESFPMMVCSRPVRCRWVHARHTM